MSKFLFAVQPAMGHLNPMLSIAHELHSAGHEVTFACTVPGLIEKAVTRNGFRLVGIGNLSPSVISMGEFILSIPSGFLETVNATRLCYHRLKYIARATGEVQDDIRPDVVVSDFTFPAACLAAEARNIPFVVIYHAGLCYDGPGIPPFGSGLPIGGEWGWRGKVYGFISRRLEYSLHRITVRARRRLGLLPNSGRSYRDLSPWLTLMTTAEAIEAPRQSLPSTAFFIGPCMTDRKNSPEENDFPFHRLSTDRPRIYISLGTFFHRRTGLFRMIINALGGDEYQLLVNAGSAFERLSEIEVPSSVLIFRNMPQLELLPRVDAVISHGGNNTVNETLAAGKPLLVMPIGGEQGDNAARVVYLGAGLRADRKRSSAQEIALKMKRLIEEPAFKRRAEELAEALGQTEGPATAARFIIRVAESGKPLVRPEGYPLTVKRDTVLPWEWGISSNEP